MEEPTIQIVGMGTQTIQLPVSHIHGDKHQLIQNPLHAHIYIRRVLPKMRPATGGPPWKSQTARSIPPAADKPSRTYFNGNVYPHLQHALLACLVRCVGGNAEYTYHNNVFPMFRATGNNHLCPAVSDPALGIHWLASEPSHAQLLDFGQRLQETDLRWCMLLIGNPHPVTSRWPAGRPQFRGLLLDAKHFVTGDTAIAKDAVQPGWYACLAPSLLFAMHGECGGQALAPALFPSLSSLGHCLWRRADGVYAIDGKQRNATTWDAAMEKEEDATISIRGNF